MDDAAKGRGGVVVVIGDAGVGKSRLAREITAAAAARGFLTLAGRAVETTVPVPFRPVAEALIRAARGGLAPSDPTVADYGPALARLVPDWDGADRDSAEVTPAVLGEAVVRLLSQDGRRAILVLEDLQWADSETLAVVEFLAGHPGWHADPLSSDCP